MLYEEQNAKIYENYKLEILMIPSFFRPVGNSRVPIDNDYWVRKDAIDMIWSTMI